MGKDRLGLRDRYGPGRCGGSPRGDRCGSGGCAPCGRVDRRARHPAPAPEPGRRLADRQVEPGKIGVMILARVVGTVVATRKDPRLEGKKLLILKPVSPDGKDEAGYVVSVDTVSAGYRERVIAVSGSSARMAEGCKDTPVDTAIIGIVDDLRLD